jgi:hypothetical protein
VRQGACLKRRLNGTAWLNDIVSAIPRWRQSRLW